MSHFQPADIRADDHQIGQLLLFEIFVHHRRGIEMIDWNIEKP